MQVFTGFIAIRAVKVKAKVNITVGDLPCLRSIVRSPVGNDKLVDFGSEVSLSVLASFTPSVSF